MLVDAPLARTFFSSLLDSRADESGFISGELELMFCRYCGAENPEGGRFCAGCRRGLAAQRSRAVRTPRAAGPRLDSLDVAETRGAPRSESGATLAAGHILAGRWRVDALLGRGGMGEVYRVFDERTKRARALKPSCWAW